MNGRIVHAGRIADRTLSFVIELEDRLGFRTGQSCDVIIKSPLYTDEKGAMRTFTIASPPSQDPRLTFATRDTGSAFKRTIAEASPGLAVEVDGPWGEFTLHDDAARPAVFLAGGIGITPFHSMIADVVAHGHPHRITLFYSNRTLAGAAFLDELTGWSRHHPNIRVIPITTGAPAGGRLSAELIAKQVRREDRPIYYAAGTEAFVAAMGEALRSSDVDPLDIRTDEFPGY